MSNFGRGLGVIIDLLILISLGLHVFGLREIGLIDIAFILYFKLHFITMNLMLLRKGE